MIYKIFSDGLFINSNTILRIEWHACVSPVFFFNCINWHTSSIINSFRWHIIGKSECSSHCGQGYRSLDVHCMRYSVHKGQTVPVDDHHCSDQLKPPTREPCHGACVLARWHYSEWSQVQMRSIT